MGAKLLALDIGGVCVKLTPEKGGDYLGIEPLNQPGEQLAPVISAYSCGRMTSEEFTARLSDYTNHRFSDGEIHEGWNMFIESEHFKTTRLIRHLLGKGWRFVFFSDTQPWHTEKLSWLLPYYDEAFGYVFSYEVGAEKPSPLMYEAFEKKYGKPDLYLDDRLDNIQGGLARGWNAVQFTSPDMADELIARL